MQFVVHVIQTILVEEFNNFRSIWIWKDWHKIPKIQLQLQTWTVSDDKMPTPRHGVAYFSYIFQNWSRNLGREFHIWIIVNVGLRLYLFNFMTIRWMNERTKLMKSTRTVSFSVKQWMVWNINTCVHTWASFITSIKKISARQISKRSFKLRLKY